MALHFGINYSMLDDDKLEAVIRDLILDICEILHKNGLKSVPVGAMMRLVGVQGEDAAQHDNEFFMLDDTFLAMLETKNNKIPQKAPSGVTLH